MAISLFFVISRKKCTFPSLVPLSLLFQMETPGKMNQYQVMLSKGPHSWLYINSQQAHPFKVVFAVVKIKECNN
jgi:hypothetical protein